MPLSTVVEADVLGGIVIGIDRVTTRLTYELTPVPIRGLRMPTARALLRGVTSVLIGYLDTDFCRLVRHKRLEFAEGPSVHLPLSAMIAILHPVADMVKLFEYDGIYIMVKRLLDDDFRHAVDIVFAEAVFSSFQAFEDTPCATSAFFLKTALGAKATVALPIVETSVEELGGGRNGNVVDTQVDSHSNAGALIQHGLSDRNVEEEHPIPVAERRRPHLVVGIIKVLLLIIAQDIVGSHAPIDRGKGAMAILDRDCALVVNDRTEVPKRRLAGLTSIGPSADTRLDRLSNSVTSRTHKISGEIGGIADGIIGGVVQLLLVVVLAFPLPSNLKHHATGLAKLPECFKHIALTVWRNIHFDLDGLGQVLAHMT